MITDPWFFAVAIPAVLIFGISKGGFGGGAGAAAVPLMALVISPIQAAAILLPILCIMDLVALWKFRGKWIWSELKILLPASLLGITIGTVLFEYMSAGAVRLIIGFIVIIFILDYLLKLQNSRGEARRDVPQTYGILGGGVAGFTSFVAHSGGPPVTMYLLRRPLNRTDFAATATVFFAVVNYVKVVPYFWIGQFSLDNLYTSASLVILAPIGVLIGVWLHKRITDKLFFAIIYVILFIVGIKLIFDGLSEFL